ncbi:MAG TPA: YdeI/OmpD-associated family protein [Candidatus Sulfotelmatobacter sp.]|nr:YdeI/OmpD-associated family protein [Candidatus Sulfotelmatobacter sp.]
MPSRVTFKVRLSSTPGRGHGSFIVVPPDVAAELGLKGRPKIQAVIAGHPYRGSLMPMGDGTFGLGVLKAIEQAAGIAVGDTIAVQLGLDTAPRVVEPPADLQSALDRDPSIAARWEKLSFTDQKEMARGIEEAKKPETRDRRLTAALEKLRLR